MKIGKAKTSIISQKEFRENSKRPYVRAGAWNWRDIEDELVKTITGDNSDQQHGAVSLINNDIKDTYGVSPNLNVVVQIFEPGERDTPHRHTNMALFIILKGNGYSIVDDEKIEWGPGDVVYAPPWSKHEICNSSETERAIFYTIQDVPDVAKTGVWFREHPIGAESTHNVLDPES